MADFWTGLLGESLTKPGSGESVPTATALNGCKRVGLYFSAHWCPPCRGFTPVLVEYFKAVKSSDFQIVFISSDKDDQQFKSYFDGMPWLALPYTDRDRKGSISKKYGVTGIPFFVVFDINGNPTKGVGRNIVMKWEGDQSEITDVEAQFPL